ncbi:MAG: 23S rRNA (pseudouridine(1915)-N(3))-methyltransferase RlmH [Candidatus Cloacimonetes bacterium]|nr:23S rRNA (pseudouridine(1915)-N(3))-methyltransferase RlmH [Candidatus Cloacimonadota bacterium]
MIEIICLGKARQDYVTSGLNEYLPRIARYCPISMKILPDHKLSSNSTEEFVKLKESEIILRYIHPGSFKIALDEKGNLMNSMEFAAFMNSHLAKDIQFIIGGVYGLSANVIKSVDYLLSFSPFTFTHQMIRLLLAEQIYRAFTILKGKKYHY